MLSSVPNRHLVILTIILAVVFLISLSVAPGRLPRIARHGGSPQLDALLPQNTAGLGITFPSFAAARHALNEALVSHFWAVVPLESPESNSESSQESQGDDDSDLLPIEGHSTRY